MTNGHADSTNCKTVTMGIYIYILILIPSVEQRRYETSPSKSLERLVLAIWAHSLTAWNQSHLHLIVKISSLSPPQDFAWFPTSTRQFHGLFGSLWL